MLEELNSLLRSAKAGVVIEVRGNRLYLVATLPPKPNAAKRDKHQQRIGTGILANASGLQAAYQKALLLSAQVATDTFVWSDWIETPKPKGLSVGEAVVIFASEWQERWGDDLKRQGTWAKDYAPMFKRLPPTMPLDADRLKRWIEGNSKPDSRSRKKMCDVIGAVLKRFEVPHNLAKIRGHYSAGKVRQRELPTDEQIVDVWRSIDREDWQWVFGMLATFGLRNHEVFFIDLPYLSSAGICLVTESKTVGGKVWPFYPEWLELFDLQNPKVPKVRATTHIDYGARVTTWFYKNKIPFTAYCLRHCWARRVIDLGLDSRLAAKMLRHGHTVHTNTYNKWLDDSTFTKAFERIKNDRQLPPPDQ